MLLQAKDWREHLSTSRKATTVCKQGLTAGCWSGKRRRSGSGRSGASASASAGCGPASSGLLPKNAYCFLFWHMLLCLLCCIMLLIAR